MKTIEKGIAACLVSVGALTAAPAALAQEEELHGFYLGGAYGQTTVKGGGCGQVGSDLASIGATVTSCDDKDTGWKIFAGYQINQNFAVEGSYIDFGGLHASATRAGVNVNASVVGTAFGIAAVGMLPIGERFVLFGKAGLLLMDVSASAVGSTGGRANQSESNTELQYGIGAMFNLSRRWAIRAEWERAEDSELDLITIGVQYRF